MTGPSALVFAGHPSLTRYCPVDFPGVFDRYHFTIASTTSSRQEHVEEYKAIFRELPLVAEWDPRIYCALSAFWPNLTKDTMRMQALLKELMRFVFDRGVGLQVVFPSGTERYVTSREAEHSFVFPRLAWLNFALVGVFDERGSADPDADTSCIRNRRDNDPDPPRFFLDIGPFLPREPTAFNMAPSGYGRFIDPHMSAGAYVAVGQLMGAAFWCTWPRNPTNQAYINKERLMAVTPATLSRMLGPRGLQELSVGVIQGSGTFLVRPSEIMAIIAVTSTAFLTTRLYPVDFADHLPIIRDTVRGLFDVHTAASGALGHFVSWDDLFKATVVAGEHQSKVLREIRALLDEERTW
jgi:hypothetical protein